MPSSRFVVVGQDAVSNPRQRKGKSNTAGNYLYQPTGWYSEFVLAIRWILTNSPGIAVFKGAQSYLFNFCFKLLEILLSHSLNSRDLFLNLRRLVKMTKPLRFDNKSLRLKYKCLICIWIIFWAILNLFINRKYLFQNKSFSQTYYFKSEKSFVILTSLLA